MPSRRLATLAIAASLLLPSPLRAFAGGATARLRCANPASGAQWEIVVDYGRRRVDSFPAEITRARIRWRDTRRGGIYDLDRKTGALTVRFASSTGGYFLYDRCQIPR